MSWFFCIFLGFFSIITHSVCGSAHAPGPLQEYPIEVMKLWGILKAFHRCDTTEVCDTAERKVKKALPGATQKNICNLFHFSKLTFKTSRF